MTLGSRGVLQTKRDRSSASTAPKPASLSLGSLSWFPPSNRKLSQHGTLYWSFFTGGRGSNRDRCIRQCSSCLPSVPPIKGVGCKAGETAFSSLCGRHQGRVGSSVGLSKEGPRWEGRCKQEVECQKGILGISIRSLGGSSERNAEFPQDAVSHPSSDRANRTRSTHAMDSFSATQGNAVLMPCRLERP